MYTLSIHGKTQRFDHTADRLAVACVVEPEVTPVKPLWFEADLDVDLDKVILFAVGRVDGEVHAVSGEIALAPVGGVEDVLDEGDGALPWECVDRGGAFEMQGRAD